MPEAFDGVRAFDDVVTQVNLGPRITGTEASLRAGEYFEDELRAAGWEVEYQPFIYRDTSARNIVARTNVGQGPIVLLGAHYDTRLRADKDPEHPTDPVPGANDGASGVAVLLELARTLEVDAIPNEIWLAFFDAEDNGELDGWEWIVGSTYMAENLDPSRMPVAMILVDMVGDSDQQFYFEANSNADLSGRIWSTAAQLGYGDHFIPQVRWSMIDDHIPFLQRGIPSVDIIDFDFPYHHTVADTPDKVSAESLERVGRTLEVFLETDQLLAAPAPTPPIP